MEREYINNDKKNNSKFPFSELNSDILSFHLTPLLDSEDIISLLLTCKTIHSKLDNDVVWHQLYTKSFHTFPLLTSVPINPVIENRSDSDLKNTTTVNTKNDLRNIENNRNTSHQQQSFSNWHDFYKLRKRARFYAWGSRNNTNVLGDVEFKGKYNCKPLESRIPLQKRLGESISKVDAGGFSFQILTTEGKLYKTNHHTPQLICNTRYQRVKMVSSGRTNYIAVNEKNELLVGDGMSYGGVDKLDRFDFNTNFTAQELSRLKLAKYKPERLNIYNVKAGWHKEACRTFDLPSGIIIWHSPSVSCQRNEFKCNASMIRDIENDPILDYLLLSRCVIYITKNGSLYRVDIDQDDYNTTEAPTPDNLHMLTHFHSYANAHRVDRFSDENPKFVRISGHFHNFAVVTDDGQLLLGQIESDVPTIIDELQPASLNASDDGRHHGIVSVAVGNEHYLALNDKGEVYSWGVETEYNGGCGLGTPDEVIGKGWGHGIRHLEIPKPHKVEFGDGMIALDVCACGYQSGALLSRL
ncbi:unnamed protein product [Ambrosiozyma monospora]|uniref:Unnamed protein product n=1 Tax=Ambrosiozyma monospora TaxID=43982 RepID=A0A9W7DGV7_AMBMO|nr:unnamed protein product [Ambrosiozyma monospora]